MSRLTRISDLPDKNGGGGGGVTYSSGGGGGGGGGGDLEGKAAYGGSPNTAQGMISFKETKLLGSGLDGGGGGGPAENANSTYIPLNIHPNPYNNGGGGGGGEGVGGGGAGGVGGGAGGGGGGRGVEYYYDSAQGGGAMDEEKPLYPLPGHDIPGNNHDEYSRDDAVTVNYIPPVSSAQMAMEKEYIATMEQGEARKWDVYSKDTRERELTDRWIDRMQKPMLAMLLFFILQMPLLHLGLVKYVSPILPICNAQGEINFFGLVFKTVLFGLALVAVDEIALFVADF